MKQNMISALLLASSVLAGAGCSTNSVPGNAQHINQSFEAFADGYASPGDKGDGIVYKFSGFDRVLGETYHTGVRQARFFKWCSANGHGDRFSDNGDLALRGQLRKLYPADDIAEGNICGDGKGGFYGYAYFKNRQQTAFLKAGVLNPKVVLDFWPEKGNPQDFWEAGRHPQDMWPNGTNK